jgi:hypothetical protein
MWTVWVGGTEVTDSLVTLRVAEIVSEFWLELGYDDVVLEKVTA